MWKRLRVTHSLSVRRQTVETLIKQIDPEGVASRLNVKFKRRKYCALGPNHIWHIDGYSRLVLWLKVKFLFLALKFYIIVYNFCKV